MICISLNTEINLKRGFPDNEIYNTSSSSCGYTEASSTGREGGVPGGIQAAPFSPAHIQRASASLRVEPRSMWPLNSLMNFRRVSKSICSPIILLRYLLRMATQMYRCRCSLRWWVQRTSHMHIVLSYSNSLQETEESEEKYKQPNYMYLFQTGVTLASWTVSGASGNRRNSWGNRSA